MRQGKAKYLFPGNNTPYGFVSHYPDGILGLEQVFILKGGPGVGKSTLIRKIGISMLERGYDVEFWQCSSDNDSLDGVMIPAISTAIIDGTAPHTVDPKYPGAVEEIINLGDHWNRSMLKNDKKEIINLSDSISSHFVEGYQQLAQAGQLLEEQLAAAMATIDQEAVAHTSAALTEAIYCPNHSQQRHLFSTAVTPRGMVSFAEPLSRLAAKRWLLFGPASCGKHLILAELAKQAEKHGHFAEIYHPALQPEQIELLILPNLDISIWDTGSEAPEPTGDDDIIIDCSSLNEQASTDTEQAIEQLVAAAASHLAKAKEQHDKLEQHYIKAMDFEGVDACGAELFNRILSLCAKKEAGKN